MTLTSDPRRVFKFLLIVTLLLLCAHILGVISTYYFNHDQVFGLVPLFNFNFEANIPTFYQCLALLACSVLLAVIANYHHKNNSSYFHWASLSAIFLFLSIDEFTMLHEKLVLPFRGMFNTTGFLYFAWVIPYAILVALIGILYLRFLLRLPGRTRTLFIVAGAIYVTGALFFELLDGYFVSNEIKNIGFAIVNTVEEYLEMFGIIVFIYALQDYMGRTIDDLHISIRNGLTAK
ncbi:MAG: hypothetical protein MJA29_10415 [Candidatus Omnitrophica bacterium]|nr:hypothetical protein [Candidatus Omnitrophota bacterium]